MSIIRYDAQFTTVYTFLQLDVNMRTVLINGAPGFPHFTTNIIFMHFTIVQSLFLFVSQNCCNIQNSNHRHDDYTNLTFSTVTQNFSFLLFFDVKSHFNNFHSSQFHGKVYQEHKGYITFCKRCLSLTVPCQTLLLSMKFIIFPSPLPSPFSPLCPLAHYLQMVILF